MSDLEGRLPAGPLVTWYGDDFTGAAAVMEVLTLAGLPSVLFLNVPGPDLLARFSGYRGMGIAGVARSKSPKWMEQTLPRVFETLAGWGAPLVHYKVCSTLDSAPHIGSIGKAVDLAERHFHQSWVPLLLAAPPMHRYQLFANLFACAGGVGYRLDRHPTTSRHPVTPMDESDVRVHLSRQTDIPLGLVDYLALKQGRADSALNGELTAGHRFVAIDTVDETTLIEAGRLIWNRRSEPFFVVGSQGVEYALTAYWRSLGLLPPETKALRSKSVERIAVVSGSCSPVTEDQISWAESNGFEPIRIDVRQAVDERAWEHAIANAVHAAVSAVGAGRDPIVFTARGPDDPAIGALFEAAQSAGADLGVVNQAIGQGLGKVLQLLFQRTSIRRGILAGGDTSGYGIQALNLQALTLSASTIPGAGLFHAHSNDAHFGALEIALKGGQMGTTDYFRQIKSGGLAA